MLIQFNLFSLFRGFFSSIRNITKVEGNYKILMCTVKKDYERQPEERKLSS